MTESWWQLYYISNYGPVLFNEAEHPWSRALTQYDRQCRDTGPHTEPGHINHSELHETWSGTKLSHSMIGSLLGDTWQASALHGDLTIIGKWVCARGELKTHVKHFEAWVIRCYLTADDLPLQVIIIKKISRYIIICIYGRFYMFVHTKIHYIILQIVWFVHITFSP